MIKVIFFDLDDTLLNHSGAEKKALSEIKRIYHPQITDNDFMVIWTGKARANWKLYELGRLNFQQQRINRIKNVWEEFSQTIDDSSAEKVFDQYLKLYELNWKLFPGVVGALRELKNHDIRLGVISNGNLSQQEKKMGQTRIRDFFDNQLIIVSEQVGFAKPDPRIFTYAQVAAGCLPRNILYVGDDVARDIEPVLTLGWNVVLMDHFKRSLETNYPQIYSINQLVQQALSFFA